MKFNQSFAKKITNRLKNMWDNRKFGYLGKRSKFVKCIYTTKRLQLNTTSFLIFFVYLYILFNMLSNVNGTSLFCSKITSKFSIPIG